MPIKLSVPFLLLGLVACTSPDVTIIEEIDVYVSGTDGYHTYRIPAVVTTPSGIILAFSEGRKGGRGDAGAIDLLLKRSIDNGTTWQATQVICNGADNTCGNPAPVVDRETGTIWLLMTWNLGTDAESEIMDGTSEDSRRVFVTHSRDDGLSWAEPEEITDDVKPEHWRWYATGPGNGIQLTRGSYRGRLVIPANHSDHLDPDVHPYRSHIIYSDDHGASWQIGGILDPMTNESTIVELADGTLMDNMRSYAGQNRRAVATSTDGGLSWSAVRLDRTLVEPVCQASILRYSWPEDGRSRILFSNPADTERTHMTLRISYDEGRTWPVERLVYEGPAAYSNLTVLPDGGIGIFYEQGRESPYEKLVFTRIPLQWLEP